VNPQRNTIQRQIIMDTLKRLRTHPTVDEIYNAIKQIHPTISKSTVYRNLRQLAENGEIRQLSLPDGLERYDGCMDRHYHFRCYTCGKVFDVDIEYLTDINEKVHRKYGFQIDRHEVVFTGICLHCIS